MKREDNLCSIIKGMQVASQNNVKPLLLAESTMTQGLPKNEVALGKGRAFLCLAWPARLQVVTVQKKLSAWLVSS